MTDGCDRPGDQLIPYEEAVQKLLQHAQPLTETLTLPVTEALGQVLAEDLQSSINVPPADNSAMDGYAVHSRDLQAGSGQQLQVAQRIPAGSTGEPLQAGTAARIFTGAVIPEGADAVVMQEQVERDGDRITINAEVKSGQNIRRTGEDIEQGAVILQQGCRIRAQEMGLAASIGYGELTVRRALKVGIFFTGDELVEPGRKLAPGQIYDSNRYTLNGLLKSLGCDIVDLGIVGDTLEQTTLALQQAAAEADLIISCGGVSVGDEDHVRIALEQLGELFMWKLNIKPGKPLAFGSIDGTAFLGLPGNPVSVFATFCLFVGPYIKKMQGRSNLAVPLLQVSADFDWPRPDKRKEFVRARLHIDEANNPSATIYPNQGSGVLTSTSWADGFVIVNEGQPIKSGDMVNYLSFKELLG